MKLVTVPKMMQVGTRISYQPVGGGTTASGTRISHDVSRETDSMLKAPPTSTAP